MELKSKLEEVKVGRLAAAVFSEDGGVYRAKVGTVLYCTVERVDVRGSFRTLR